VVVKAINNKIVNVASLAYTGVHIHIAFAAVEGGQPAAMTTRYRVECAFLDIGFT
jgi:hypothetical protein